MKKVEAVIRKSKFLDVKKALHEVGVNFFSFWEVTGFGKENDDEDLSKVISNSTTEIERYYMSIVVNDDFEEVTIKAILDAAPTGEVGDGVIFVSPVNEVYRIRTGEKGPNTLR
ncbi:P-II family nitrogen regulator [Lacinutrix cladophorae]